MAGQVIRVIPKADYDFTGVTVAGKTSQMFAAIHIDASNYTQGELVARLHSTDWDNGGGTETVEIKVVQDAHTDEEPQTLFGGQELAVAEFVQGTDSEPTAKIEDLVETYKLGGMLAVLVVGTRVIANTGTFTVTLSADLVLKE